MSEFPKQNNPEQNNLEQPKVIESQVALVSELVERFKNEELPAEIIFTLIEVSNSNPRYGGGSDACKYNMRKYARL